MTADRERFEHLVPFYVNGTLSGADKAFVDAYLDKHEHARQSLTWTTNVQQTIQTLADPQPDDQRLARFLEKAAATSVTSTEYAPMNNTPCAQARLKGWGWVLTGLGVAAMAATLVIAPTLVPSGSLHWDQLDGRPDVQLTLAKNLNPSDPLVEAYLAKHDGQIVGQTLADGHHQIEVDLKNRAQDQHRLIQDMTDQGHLESYTLLATR